MFQIYNENWCHLSIIVNKEENRVGDGFEQKPLIQWVLYLFNGIHFFNFGINDLKCISFLYCTLIQWVLYLFIGIHFFNFGINDSKCISFLHCYYFENNMFDFRGEYNVNVSIDIE